jgi:peptide/nickel transport system substrate-binding protein
VKANFDHWLNIPESYQKPGYTYYIDTVIGHGDGSNFASIEATDPSTVTVKLKAANSALLTQLTLVMFGIQSPAAMAAGHADDPDFAKNTYAQGGPGAMVGTGPFKFKEWVLKDHVTIEKNADYWDKSAGPYLDTVTYRPIGDPTAMANQLQAGDIDLVQSFAPVDVPTIKGDANLQYFDRGSACNVGTLKMNHNHKPFDNVKIRQAVAYAINRQAIVDAFFGPVGILSQGWAPPGTKFNKDQPIPTYDPEKAKQLIAESGVTDLSFDAWYPSDVSRPYMPDPKGEFEAILNDLTAVGFKPNPQVSSWSDAFLPAANAGQYPMFLVGWNCDWLGIDNFLQTGFFGYQSGKPNAAIAYKNDEMNAAMVAAIQAPDDATAQAEWDKAQAFLVQDMPIVPIVSAVTPAAGKATIKGFVPSPTQLELFKSVWLDQ